MATLLSGVSSNGAGSGASHSGPCTVIVEGDSVMDGAKVEIQIAAADTAGKYVTFGSQSILREPNAVAVAAEGTYFLRALVSNAGASTSINCVSNQ